MRNLKWLLLNFVFLSSASFHIHGQSNEKNKRCMVGDLTSIRNIYDLMYAPADWKKTYNGWDLQDEYAKGIKEIESKEKVSVKDFQRILKNFFNSMHDYHVNVQFFSTESSTLPFSIKGVNGRYFFSNINRDQLSPKAFPFTLGDELVMFDGRPTDDVVQEIRMNELRGGNPFTDQTIAEMYLTKREGKSGFIVPTGPVTIAVGSAETGENRSYQLIWHHVEELITSRSAPAILKTFKSLFAPKPSTHPFFEKKMITTLFQEDAEDEKGVEHNGLGSRKSFIPDLGIKWWESSEESPYYAYIYETSCGRRIGYVRIPHYMGNQEEAAEFENIIKRFQNKTEAIVIDQVDNFGGLVFYMYTLASMLTDRPLATPKHRLKLTQQEVAMASLLLKTLENVESDIEAQVVIGETLIGYPVTYQFVQFFIGFCRFMISEWNAGKTMTDPIYLYGVDHINPHPKVSYSKPILLLINELDFSGGDFFPAILQDNERAVIMGKRTAGAGGCVTTHQFPNQFGISTFSYTFSIAERTNHSYIEGLGVTPDVEYNVTVKDLQNGYSNYAEAINKAVEGLILD